MLWREKPKIPSLNSLTGIIEAISLTDADAGVLYRKMGLHSAKPRLYVLSEVNSRLRVHFAKPKITWTLVTFEMLPIGS